MMEPRPIEPSEIRVGDRVRRSRRMDWGERTDEFTVLQVGSFQDFKPTTGSWWLSHRQGATWTLLDRPEPPREVGSRWRDPETGARYVRTEGNDPDVNHYVRYSIRSNAPPYLSPKVPGEAAVLARLVPLDTP